MPTETKSMSEYWERPCAALGLRSYRARGRYGWVMIGARDDADAMREALRSTDRVETLERWDGARYVPTDARQTEREGE